MSKQKQIGKKRSDDEAAKYRTLFDSIDEGFVISELLFDAEGNPFDLLVLETNASFERLMQTATSSVGKRALEIFPTAEASWFETYGRVIETEESVRFENHLAALDRWFDLYISRIGESGSRRFAIVFHDITERKRAETKLAFLAEVSQDLVGLTSIDETMNRLGEKIGQFFGVKQCLFAEHADEFETVIVAYGWNAESTSSLKGTYRTRDFLSDELMTELMTGEPIVVSETQSDVRVSAVSYGALGIRSFIIVPLVREGEWRFQISIIDNTPRDWRDDEIELMRELTTRIWTRLERARAEEAMRLSEQRLRRMVNVSHVGVLRFDYTGTLIDANDAFLDMTGYNREELEKQTFTWRDFTPLEYIDASERIMEQLRETGRGGPYEKEYFRKDGSRLWMMFVAADLGHGTIVEYAIDIHDRKTAEKTLREQQATLQSFYDSAPFLMGIAELAGDQIVAVSGNLAVAEFFATYPAALPGKRRGELGNPEEIDRLWLEKYRRSQIDDSPIQFVYEHPHAKGLRWLRATVAFIGKGTHENPRFSFVVEDITEHKRAEEALHENQKQLQLLNETLEQKVEEKTEEVRQLATGVINGTQQERQRLSRVLHDDLQQRAFAILMQLSFLRDELPSENHSARKEVSNIEKELVEIVKITRNLSIDLSPPILPGEGLSHAIEWFASRVREQFALPVEVRTNGPRIIANENLHGLLFNCVRELLFNVVKHAGASQAVIVMESSDHYLRIEVRDDGKGFPDNMSEDGKASKQGNLPQSLGLPSIRHQLSLFGGSMEINSKPRVGTQVILIVPVAKASQGVFSSSDRL